MAIKVSGTEVISDSRALNNIASIDATTATAITAGGVGGGDFVLLNSGTLDGVTALDLTTPTTYKNYKLILAGAVEMAGTRRAEVYGTYNGSTYTGNWAWGRIGVDDGFEYGDTTSGSSYINLLFTDVFNKQDWGLYANIDIFTGRVSATEDSFPAISWQASASRTSLDGSTTLTSGVARERDATTYLRGVRFRLEGAEMDGGYYAFYGLSV